jgi:hypothetical protein
MQEYHAILIVDNYDWELILADANFIGAFEKR